MNFILRGKGEAYEAIPVWEFCSEEGKAFKDFY